MPKAPGRGGAEKAKAVSGMMHKTRNQTQLVPADLGEEWVAMSEVVSSFCVARIRHQDGPSFYSAQPYHEII